MTNLPAAQLSPVGLTADQLTAQLAIFNEAYRLGEPMISDSDYEHVWLAELARVAPDSPFLSTPEPEPVPAVGARVKLMAPMLSTDKLHPVEVLSSF